jgi:hypothetical protein
LKLRQERRRTGRPLDRAGRRWLRAAVQDRQPARQHVARGLLQRRKTHRRCRLAAQSADRAPVPEVGAASVGDPSERTLWSSECRLPRRRILIAGRSAQTRRFPPLRPPTLPIGAFSVRSAATLPRVLTSGHRRSGTSARLLSLLWFAECPLSRRDRLLASGGMCQKLPFQAILAVSPSVAGPVTHSNR